MKSIDRRTIGYIIAVGPHLCDWQAEIEKEQETVIGDLVSPAKTVIKQLIALDNRRIDLCNLHVLNAFIERGLGERLVELKECIDSGTDSALFTLAAGELARTGYDTARARKEFAYLFKRVAGVKRRTQYKPVLPEAIIHGPSVF